MHDLKFDHIYKRSDPERAIIDKKSTKSYQEQTRDLRLFENRLTMMANEFLATDGTVDGIALCVLDWLYEWAAGNAYLGETNAQGKYIRQWGLAVLASAYGQIAYSPALPDEKRIAVEKWLIRVADEVIEDYSYQPSVSVTMRNNHLYWAAWSVSLTGVVLDERRFFEWGINKVKWALHTQVADDGSLPLELDRGRKALHYHVFALTPLVMIAEIARLNGINLYDLNNEALHRIARLTFAGMKDPSWFKKQTGEKQDNIKKMSAEHLAWLVVYNGRFPDQEITAWLDDARPVFARRAGGDVSFLYNREDPLRDSQLP